MPRRRKIASSISTEYFQDGTPLWVPPGKPEIAQHYHHAVQALAEWVGPDWHKNKSTNFFLIGSVIIDSCESWRNHNWDGDRRWIDERKNDAKCRTELEKASSVMLRVLEKTAFRSLKKELTQVLMRDLGVEVPHSLTNVDGITAVERTFRWLASRAKIRDRARAKFGAIEYFILPKQLPGHEVVIALCLANQITFFRQDDHSRGGLDAPHSPDLSQDLPWKAIALFATANSDDGDVLDESKVQTLVSSLAKSVDGVFWRSDHKAESICKNAG